MIKKTNAIPSKQANQASPNGLMLSGKEKKRLRRFKEMVESGRINLTDDIAFRISVAYDISTAQEILDCVFEEGEYTIEQVSTESELRAKAGGKAVRLDFFARDKRQRLINIEMQMHHRGDILPKVRENLSQIDAHQLNAGDHSSGMKDTVAVTFMGKDIFGEGEARYEVEHRIRKSGTIVNFGQRIVFINLAHPGREGRLGKLIGDLLQNDWKKISSEKLRSALQFVIEGGEDMWTAALRGDPKTIKARSDQMHFEKGHAKGEAKEKRRIILHMHRERGLPPEQIALYVGVDLDEVLSIIKSDDDPAS